MTVTGFSVTATGYIITLMGCVVAMSDFIVVMRGFIITMTGGSVTMKGFTMTATGFSVMVMGYIIIMTGFVDMIPPWKLLAWRCTDSAGRTNGLTDGASDAHPRQAATQMPCQGCGPKALRSCLAPGCSDARGNDPPPTIDDGEARSGDLGVQDQQLLVEEGVLGDELGTWAERLPATPMMGALLMEWRQGKRDVVCPFGTWAMSAFHWVLVEAAPAPSYAASGAGAREGVGTFGNAEGAVLEGGAEHDKRSQQSARRPEAFEPSELMGGEGELRPEPGELHRRRRGTCSTLAKWRPFWWGKRHQPDSGSHRPLHWTAHPLSGDSQPGPL